MDQRWRKLVLGVFGFGTAVALLLASGVLTPPTRAEPGPAALPAAVALPDASIANPNAGATGGGAAAQTPDARVAELTKELLTTPQTDGKKWAELASLHLDKKRYPLAADALSEAMELERDNHEYRSGYATSLFFMGMSRMALREYRQIVAADPNNAGAHMNLAIALSHGVPPDIDAAVAEWKEVVRLAPDQPVATQAQQYLASYSKRADGATPK